MKHCICFSLSSADEALLYLDILILLVCVRVRMHYLSEKLRMREIKCRILRKLTKSPSANCLFASKDHVRSVAKRLCVIFMACSCPKFVLGR